MSQNYSLVHLHADAVIVEVTAGRAGYIYPAMPKNVYRVHDASLC